MNPGDESKKIFVIVVQNRHITGVHERKSPRWESVMFKYKPKEKKRALLHRRREEIHEIIASP